ncbi:MAG: hypothetical protein JXJ04_03960 [Spirochaetales bacterium]|nr:hypothetical protein [Spirochaetales bacterium]
MKEKIICMCCLICLFSFFSCVEPIITCKLTIESDSPGTTTPSGTVEVEIDREISITATPGQGYVFQEWSVTQGSGVTIADPVSGTTTVILKSGDAAIYAHFSELSGLKHEYGIINNPAQAYTDEWMEKSFSKEYKTPPVVVMGLISRNDSSPAVMRVKDVTLTGFSYKIDEWDDHYSLAAHGAENISYMVFEEGVHSLFNDTLTVLAGKITGTRDWETIVFPTPFQEGTPPVVVSQCISFNHVDNYSVATRQQNISNEGADLKLQLRYDHVNDEKITLEEEVGWIAFEMEYSSIPGMRFEVSRTPVEVDLSVYTLNYHNLYINPPFFMGMMQTYNGNEVATLRSSNVTITNAFIFIEETPATQDTAHSDESIGYICIELD